MDIAYVFKNDPENGSQELRYSLRSLANLPHSQVFIAGEKPEWLANVTYLELFQEPYTDNYEVKHLNVGRNIMALCNQSELSDDFVLMNDDFFIMQQMDEIPTRHWGSLDDVIAYYDVRYPSGNIYLAAMKRTRSELQKRGMTDLKSYELHVPFKVNKQKFLDLMEEFHEIFWEGETCLSQWRTIYGNYYKIGGNFMDDVKVFKEAKNNNPNLAIGESEFLSGTGWAFAQMDFGNYVRKQFSLKSPYEN